MTKEEGKIMITREQADDMIKIINASVEGKTIQVQDFPKTFYTDCKVHPYLLAESHGAGVIGVSSEPIDRFRIKPTAGYRPYTIEELFDYMLSGQEFIHTESRKTGQILSIDTYAVVVVEYNDRESTKKRFFPEDFMKEHTIDGKPAGMLIEVN